MLKAFGLHGLLSKCYIIIIRGHPSVTYAGVASGAGMAIFCATFLVIVVCAIVKRRRASKLKSEWGK